MMATVRRWFDFQGRYGIVEFFAALAITGGLAVLGWQIMSAVVGQMVFNLFVSWWDHSLAHRNWVILAESAVALLLLCTAVWVNLAAACKRLHDLGHSGWYATVLVLLWAGTVAAFSQQHQLLMNLGIVLLTSAYVGLVSSLGSPDDNAYGKSLI